MKEKLIKTTVYLEEEVIEAVDGLKKKLSGQTGGKWSFGAVVGLALSEFFAEKGL